MHHFFVEPSQIDGKKIMITGKDVNHIKNVLRMKAGEEISVSNGVDGREYRCGIETLREDRIECTLRFIKEEGVELPARICLFQGIPKADKMDLIVQKAVELGASEIVPLSVKRCVVRLDAKKEKSRIARWQGIAEAAAKQSRRHVIPAVRDIMTMKQAVAYASQMDVRLIPYELAEGMEKTKRMLEGIAPGRSVAVFIGPEGGFDDSEIEEAAAVGIEPVTMGRRILRTETAGFTILAWIMYQLECAGI